MPDRSVASRRPALVLLVIAASALLLIGAIGAVVVWMTMSGPMQELPESAYLGYGGPGPSPLPAQMAAFGIFAAAALLGVVGLLASAVLRTLRPAR